MYFFIFAIIIVITLTLIIAVNENALQKVSCWSMQAQGNCYTFIQFFFFFLNETFCAVVPPQILMFYSV